jgi:hypothetical protein
MSYTKLFSSIVTSTIWTEDAKICKVWVTMLAIANKHGEVHASIPGLAQIAGLGLHDTEHAINKFLSPDKYSRTPDDEGRRIEMIEGGWLLLNHAKYRAMASKDEEKIASAKRQAAFKERKRRNKQVTESNGEVTPSNDTVTQNRDIADTDTDTDPFKENILSLSIDNSPESAKKPKPNATPEMIRIGKIMGRRESTKWSKQEIQAFKDADFVEEEIRIVEDFYRFEERSNDQLFRRTGLLSLLNHWPDEVSKAHKWAKKYGRPITGPYNPTGK